MFTSSLPTTKSQTNTKPITTTTTPETLNLNPPILPYTSAADPLLKPKVEKEEEKCSKSDWCQISLMAVGIACIELSEHKKINDEHERVMWTGIFLNLVGITWWAVDAERERRRNRLRALMVDAEKGKVV